MQDDQLQRLLTEIHKQMVLMNNSLDALAKVARHEHPEAFTKQERPSSQTSPVRVKD